VRSTNWSNVFAICAILGVLVGYIIVLIVRPGLIPPLFRIGGLTRPVTVLLLGTDVVYTRERRHLKADQQSFNGRSDTILLAHLDPIRNMMCVLSIPRDTSVRIPGYGRQKINAANALGGPRLAVDTIYSLLQVPIDHYIVVNVHGLVELTDELGGITVEIPKKMRYVDHSAKLNIDLEPGPHTLDGKEAMGFVRFRHDSLGDIGRVQRQEIFIRALLDKAMNPESWTKIGKLISLAQKYVYTDMTANQMVQIISFARAVPKNNQRMLMLPGHFSGTGDWSYDEDSLDQIAQRLLGEPQLVSDRHSIKVSIENGSSSPDLWRKVYRAMSDLSYNVVSVKSRSDVYGQPLKQTRIIAEQGNNEEALMVKRDLHNKGEVINASLGDIQSEITIIIGDDLIGAFTSAKGSKVMSKRGM
jgi:LCP family protein required for cell wall assembly